MDFKRFSKLIRLPNLLIIIATQWLCWFCLIVPFVNFTDEQIFLNTINIAILSLSTALIAGAGYIINDYFDVKIDAINRPEKSLIGKDINPKQAIVLHTFFNILGLVLAAYLSFKLNNIYTLTIPIICTILLWFYSTHFKRQFIIGNLIVSLLTALSILILLSFEPSLWTLIKHPFIENKAGLIKLNPAWILIGYSAFAFSLNWIREIIKDLEDFKGDAEDGCVTMPIKIGIKNTVIFCNVLTSITTLLILFAAIVFIIKSWYFLGAYLFAALAIPLIITLLNLHKSSTTDHFSFYSKLLKIVMLLGILTLLMFYYIQYIY